MLAGQFWQLKSTHLKVVFKFEKPCFTATDVSLSYRRFVDYDWRKWLWSRVPVTKCFSSYNAHLLSSLTGEIKLFYVSTMICKITKIYSLLLGSLSLSNSSHSISKKSWLLEGIANKCYSGLLHTPKHLLEIWSKALHSLNSFSYSASYLISSGRCRYVGPAE